MKNCKSSMIIAHVMLSVSCLLYFACRFFDKISNATHDMLSFRWIYSPACCALELLCLTWR